MKRRPRTVPLRCARWALAALASATLGLLAGACGDDDPYDTSCSADSDCIVVPVGRACGCENCRRTTINASERARYEEDQRDAEVDCDDGEVVCTGLPCAEPTAFCANGNCNLR